MFVGGVSMRKVQIYIKKLYNTENVTLGGSLPPPLGGVKISLFMCKHRSSSDRFQNCQYRETLLIIQ